MRVVDWEIHFQVTERESCLLHPRCRGRALAEDRACVEAADRCQRVPSMLSLPHLLFLAEAEEQETQRAARAADWDPSGGEGEPSCHHLHQSPEWELAPTEVGIAWERWAPEVATSWGLRQGEAQMAEPGVTAAEAELAPETVARVEE